MEFLSFIGGWEEVWNQGGTIFNIVYRTDATPWFQIFLRKNSRYNLLLEWSILRVSHLEQDVCVSFLSRALSIKYLSIFIISLHKIFLFYTMYKESKLCYLLKKNFLSY